MTFGILEDKYLKDVPGTSLLTDRAIHGVHGQEFSVEAGSLKRAAGRHSHIILIPQPSDDPNDPLNWPRWKKEACFWTLAFAASLDGALSPMVGPGYVLLSQQFGVSVDEVASSFGGILLGLGCFMLMQNALAVKFGHRIVYLGSVSMMFIACIWCAVSPNIRSITASRVFQGFGMSALQSLVASSIEQIYFVHERGFRNVIWSFSIMAGITLGPLLYSYVIQNISWHAGFLFVAIPLGIAIILVFFFVPETTYIRPRTPTVEPDTSSDKGKASSEKEDISLAENADQRMQAASYVSQLKIWHGTFSDVNFFKILLRPLPFLLSPVTWFIFLVHGLQTVWLSALFIPLLTVENGIFIPYMLIPGLMPICSSTIFTIEYGFDAKQIGLTNIGGIVGIVLAMAITGPLTDWGTIWLSRRNRGIYEPEFRIFFIATMLCGVFAYVGWAEGTIHNMPWIGAVACIALVNFSMVVSGSAAVTYLLDTHGGSALQVLAISNFLKNMVLYGFTFFANGMIERRGVRVSLLILGSCQAFCWLATIPMYVYGKRVRSLIARNSHVFNVAQD